MAWYQPQSMVASSISDSITGHPDHQAVGRWAATLAQISGTTNLLQAAKPKSWIDEHAGLHAKHSVFLPGFPEPVDDTELALDLHLPDDLLDQKVAALRAQATQTKPVIDVFGAGPWREWIRRECFVRPDGGGRGNEGQGSR